MPETGKDRATVTVKVTKCTHRNIRRLAAELDLTNAEAVAYAVRLALEEVRRKGQPPP